MGRKRAIPALLPMTDSQQSVLEKMIARHSTGQQMSKRANIILLAAQNHPHSVISGKMGVSVNTVKTWRNRWGDMYDDLCLIMDESKLEQAIFVLLKDLPRSGTPSKFTATQKNQIVALACDKPRNHGIEMTDWTFEMLALVAQSKGIVDSISKSQVRLFLKNAALTTA